jgi:hypothetical protein
MRTGGGGTWTRFKTFEKYVGTNHSNNKTQEREKEWRELNFSELAIAL